MIGAWGVVLAVAVLVLRNGHLVCSARLLQFFSIIQSLCYLFVCLGKGSRPRARAVCTVCVTMCVSLVSMAT